MNFNPKNVFNYFRDCYQLDYKEFTINNILSKVTLPGSIALALVAIFPYVLMQTMDVDYDLASFFGGTSLLIIVGVALDTLQQLESHLMMRHYDGFLTKGKIRGRRRM